MKKIKPRILAKFLAWLLGYFWLPCPICGKPFAGFEAEGQLMVTVCSGWCTCADCIDEAIRRNEKFK